MHSDKKNAINTVPQSTLDILLTLYKNNLSKELLNQIKPLLYKYPKDIRLLNLAGIAYFRLENFDSSIKMYQTALTIYPKHTEACNNLGVVFKTIGNYAKAVKQYEKVIALEPTDGAAYNNLGNIYLEIGELTTAKDNFEHAIKLQPELVEAYDNLGLVFKNMGDLDRAFENHSKALELKPDYASAQLNLGVIFQARENPIAAIDTYTQALKLDPKLAIARAHKLEQQASICDWTGIEQEKRIIPTLGVTTNVVTPFAMLYLEDDPLGHMRRSQLYAETQSVKNAPILTFPDSFQSTPQKIKVGYFSGDFHQHPVMHLICELFALHDRKKFEINAFSFGPKIEDSVHFELRKNFDFFYDVSEKSDNEIAILSRNKCIDIAVDLSGFTKHGRPGIFSHGAAPIQINYLGYPGTMGAKFIDYIVADEMLIPPKNREFYSEKIIYMPHSYQVSDNSRDHYDKCVSRVEFGFSDKDFIFCCFNINTKIGPREFDIWMRLLHRVPNSKLWLIKSNEWARNNLKKEASLRGIDPKRVIFSNRCGYSKYLKKLSAADLFLDTFNFNAGATANDALWCGLPVLTKVGESYSSRMASSLLNTLGLTELICSNERDYEDLSYALATDADMLSLIRNRLNSRRQNSELFNTETFTTDLESAYLAVYTRNLNKLAPEHIFIDKI